MARDMTRVFASIQREIVREVGTALFKAGERMQVAAQISITAGSVSGREHVASAPGDAPNNDTGVLANNIETVSVAPLMVEVTSKAPYAAALEFGTSKMAARPYMKPAADAERENANKIVSRAVTSAVRKATRGTSRGRS